MQIIGKGGMAREIVSCLKWGFDWGEFEELNNFKPGIPTIIAIGDPVVRKTIAEKYPYFQYNVFNYGKLLLSDSIEIGEGTIICPEAIITNDVKIGKHCIININANVHHDCVLGDYVTVSPSATICGNVTIGNLCHIGANAVIKEKITICEGVTIGCGGVVVKNITEPGTYVGNPVKKLEQKQPINWKPHTDGY